MEDYSNALRPVDDTDKALNVSLQITLSQIKDMVSREETLLCIIAKHGFRDIKPVHPHARIQPINLKRILNPDISHTLFIYVLHLLAPALY